MSAQPPYPLLIVDPKGWLGLQAKGHKSRFSLYGALSTKRWTGYDSAGEKWRVAQDSFPYPDAWWTRFLANTIYNPRFEAELHWEGFGRYSFEDLQTLICSLVDRDDDILTQFVAGDQLKTTVLACKTFDELIRKLKTMKTLTE